MNVAAVLHAAVAGAEDQVAGTPAAAAVDSVVAGLNQAQALELGQVECYLLLIPQH